METFHAYEFMLSDEQSRVVREVTETMVSSLSGAKRVAPEAARKAKQQKPSRPSDTMGLFG